VVFSRARSSAWLLLACAAALRAAGCSGGSAVPNPSPAASISLSSKPSPTPTTTPAHRSAASVSRKPTTRKPRPTSTPAPRLSRPTTHVAAPPPPPKSHPAPTGGVTAIGDSVMIDAAPSLQATIPGINVDAAVSRQASSGVQEVRSLAASGRLGRSVVFHLGTNGTLGAGDLSQLFAAAGGRHVVVLTSHCPYCSWIPSNNATIKSNCTSAHNCTVADWGALADRNPGWFTGDGVHMAVGGAGAQAYARLVASRL
jgi:hypothetical protein